MYVRVNKNLFDILDKRWDWLNCDAQKIRNLNKKLNYCLVRWYALIATIIEKLINTKLNTSGNTRNTKF